MSEEASFLPINHGSPKSPVLVSVPHAGRRYPDRFFALSRLDRRQAMPLEDRYADVIVAPLHDKGVSILVQQTARAWIDLNRDERDVEPALVRGLDPAWCRPSAKARGGLGVIPSSIAGAGAIWRAPLAAEDFERRLARHHRPFHAALADLAATTGARFGTTILLDIHSMPPLRQGASGAQPQVVLGDLFGQSCASWLTALVAGVFEGAGIPVAVNAPYPGGHILRRHGDPARGRHALQIEIDRSLYLDPMGDKPGTGLADVQAVIMRAVVALDAELRGSGFALAAE